LFEISPQTLEQARDRFAHVVFGHFVEPQGKMQRQVPPGVRPVSSLLAVGLLRAQGQALQLAIVPSDAHCG
jgi:hypothetical protein